MRLPAFTVLALLLAGCTAGDEEPEADPLFGICPQWVQGPGEHASSISLQGATSQRHDIPEVNQTHLQRPLDLLRVRLVRADIDGALELRAAAADGSGLAIRDHRLDRVQMGPVVHLDDAAEGKEFDVFLSPVLQDGPAAPTPAHLNWTLAGGQATVQYQVTFHYKVCGL